LTDAGIHVVVAAGNRDWDASKTTPARVPSVITVAASTIDDYRHPKSNYGPCIDIFAPGKDIKSVGISSDEVCWQLLVASAEGDSYLVIITTKDPAVKSGTSMVI
jgi:subtilisin family serine protease